MPSGLDKATLVVLGSTVAPAVLTDFHDFPQFFLANFWIVGLAEVEP